MEFYATVNGKPTKPCGKSFDLNDIEQRKKECLAEKRRQRILQVREQSKEFARKVRNDVAAEKERRQCKINEAKAREFQVWNTDTLARTHNYAACFGVPVGAAQYAAKLENEQRAALARMREQQQQRYCPHIGRPYNNSNRWPLRSCLKKHTTCTQTSPVQTEEVKAKKSSPKRNKVYLNEFVCRCCVSDSDHEDLSDICEDISVSSLSDAELECETRKKGKQSGKQILCKTPAVVLALDIDPNDVVTITSPGEIKDKFTQNNRQFSSVIRVSPRTKTCGKSESCQCQPTCCYSEQESSATTLGTKSSKETSGTKGSTDTVGGAKGSSDTVGAKGSTDTSGPTDSTDTVGTKGSTDSTSTKSSTHTIDSDNSTKAIRQVEESSKLPVNKAMTTKSTSMTGLDNAKKAGAGRGSKRFRQVSDLLEKRANKATQMEENIQISKDTQTDCRPPPCAKIRGSKSRSITSAPKQNSKTYPQDEQEPSTSQPVQKPIDLTSERDCVQENISPKITTRSSLLKDKDAVRRSTDIVTFERAIENNDRQFSGKDAMSINSIPVDDCVQYYDYNNKYTKAYEQPSNAVRLQPLIRSEPNAMQRARLEKEQRSFRVEKMAQMRKQCEERGQKALEREQVRRDCTELTEKLEALSKHHVPLVPTDANIIGSHHFVDLAAKKQAKMNAIMEEMLMRPAIITCPEVSCPEIKCTDAKSTGTAKTRKTKSATCLNLGDTPPDNSDGSYPSSDSCRSILLGYVNDQSKQIRSDIDEYKTNPQRNEEKSKRLCNLLQRIEQLRDALRNEIESGGSSADVQNVKEVIDSISNVRKERERILIDNITEETIMPLQKREQKKAQRESSAQEKKRKETDNQKDKPSSSDLKAKLSDIKAKSNDIKSKSSNVNNAQDAECVAKINKPLEIVIKVAGAHIKRSGSSNVKKSSARSPRHKSKSPRKATKVIVSSSVKKASKKPTVPKKPYIPATVKNISSENVAVEASSILLEVNSDDSNISTNPTSNVVIHSSYDSNSTAYRSLPPKVSNNVDKVVEKIPSKTRQAAQAVAELIHKPEGQLTPKRSRHQSAGPPARLNPLIAHYVQRLLGMSRNSINTLGVSTSEIDTPSSSIINTTANRPEMVEEEEELLARERIDRVQSFIDENHRLIQELEESLRTSNITENALETSMKAFEMIWKQQLKESEKQKSQPASRTKIEQTTNTQTILESNENILKIRMENQKSRDQIKKSTQSEQAKQISAEVQQHARSKSRQHAASVAAREGGDIQNTKVSSSQHLDAHLAKQMESNKRKQVQLQAQGDDNVDSTQSQNREINRAKATAAVTAPKPALRQNQDERNTQKHLAQAGQKSSQITENPTDAEGNARCPDFERYAELTTNCTQRIAELTHLINKVRKEKQKILESTLSSVSENERHSTEYMDLPESGQVGDGQRCSSESSVDGRVVDSASYVIKETSTNLKRDEKATPLDKHKSTGHSRDSGISESRPVTAQDLHLDLESLSHASNTQTTSHASATRKHKPPPTLTRFSPQLAEEEHAHELSTILEVDTPVTSRLNATALQTQGNGRSSPPLQHAYLRSEFPTFDQYVRSLNLDLTQINVEQSIRIQQEFDELVAAFSEAKCNRDLHYQEFPSIGAYLQGHEQSGDGIKTLSETLPENIENLLACMRNANVDVEAFPTQREYLQRIKTNTPEEDPLDSASLENYTLNSGRDPTTESETINIEEELRRRNVLQQSFRTLSRGESKADERRQSNFPPMLVAESGIEKLSTSEGGGTAELEKDFLGLGMRWHTAMLRKIKETQALSSSSTTTSTTLVSASRHMPSARNTPKASNSEDSSASMAQKSDENVAQELRRPLSLRDFLTKELLKQNITTSTSDSTDDSLRSSFLRSIIGTMTPGEKPAPASSSSSYKAGTSTAAAATGGDRQKTSTPVASHGTQTGSGINSSSMSISTQLFSGESRLSSVHY